MKRIKYLVLVIFAFIITGCSTSITPDRIDIANEFCKSNGGLLKLEVISKMIDYDYDITIYCKNGLNVNMKEAKSILNFTKESKIVQD